MPPKSGATRSSRPMPDEQAEQASVKVPLFSASRERSGDFEVSAAVFGRTGSLSLLHEAVRMQLAKRRSGTAATKTRGFISGGGRKPWRQKGTGRARAGSTRSPLWRHGGTIFGPQPRDYSYKMPKKTWRPALSLAISDRALNGKMVVVESLDLAEAKTKLAKQTLEAWGLMQALIVLADDDKTFDRPTRKHTGTTVSARE